MTPVSLEPAAHRSRVKHSTTEPLRYLMAGGSGGWFLTEKHLLFGKQQVLGPILCSKKHWEYPAHLRDSKSLMKKWGKSPQRGVSLLTYNIWAITRDLVRSSENLNESTRTWCTDNGMRKFKWVCYVFVLYTISEPLLPAYMDVDEGPHAQNKEVLSEGAQIWCFFLFFFSL